MTTPEEVDETVLLHALLRHFEHVAPLGERTAGPWPGWRVQAGSALADDDARTDPYQLSHSAHHALAVAVDHLKALVALVSGTENDGHRVMLLPTHAPSTLLRVALENAARTVWLFGTGYRRERVHPCLRMHLADLKSSMVKIKLPGHALDGRQEHQEQIKDLLRTVGLPKGELSNGRLKMPGYGDIVYTAGTHTPVGGERAELFWSACGSLAHGDLHGIRTVLDRETMATDGDVSWIRLALPHGEVVAHGRSLPPVTDTAIATSVGIAHLVGHGEVCPAVRAVRASEEVGHRGGDLFLTVGESERVEALADAV
ncbi:hypothetical protein ACFWJ4_37430 [Kitasatospora sp. NPDC127067]|uniref:hypothetical protein n=1 Tax=Kitasatospora sp. NPDC127067 TaxID=3347126 RepID=UPI003656A1DB